MGSLLRCIFFLPSMIDIHLGNTGMNDTYIYISLLMCHGLIIKHVKNLSMIISKIGI